LKYREDDLVFSAVNRLRGRMAKMNAFDAFDSMADHLVAAAHAYTDRVVSEAFARAVDRVEDLALKAELERLLTLYALNTIHEDSGWFQEQGYISGPKARAIREQVNLLC